VNKIARLISKLDELDARPVPAKTADEFDEPPYTKKIDLAATVTLHLTAEVQTRMVEDEEGNQTEVRSWRYTLHFRGQLRVHISGDLAAVKTALTELADRMTVFGAALTAALA
jgi:hypothetical protein